MVISYSKNLYHGSLGHLWIDKGFRAGRCIYTGEINTLEIMVTHCTSSESSYFSLFEDNRYVISNLTKFSFVGKREKSI